MLSLLQVGVVESQFPVTSQVRSTDPSKKYPSAQVYDACVFLPSDVNNILPLLGSSRSKQMAVNNNNYTIIARNYKLWQEVFVQSKVYNNKSYIK